MVFDELAIATLAEAVALLREADDPEASRMEHIVRTHRIGILKQRAILGAAGIEV